MTMIKLSFIIKKLLRSVWIDSKKLKAFIKLKDKSFWLFKSKILKKKLYKKDWNVLNLSHFVLEKVYIRLPIWK